MKGKLADLRGCDLDGANLEMANLPFAELPSASLVGSYLTGANLRHANLLQVKLSGARVEGADFEGANLSGGDLSFSKGIGANFSDANLQYGNFVGANLAEANFKRADLQGANFKNADLSFAEMKGANLKDANLEGARLKEANFENADLRGTGFENTNFKMADTKFAISSDQISDVFTLADTGNTFPNFKNSPSNGRNINSTAKEDSSMDSISIDHGMMEEAYRGMIEKVKSNIHYDQVKTICRDRHGIEEVTEIDFERGDLVTHKEQIAVKLDFKISYRLSLLIDRSGNCTIANSDDNLETAAQDGPAHEDL